MEKIELSENIEKAVVADRQKRAELLSPFASKDADAVRPDGKRAYSALRDGYIRDCEAVVNLKQFNRYANKTQVVSLHKNNDVSNRSYHVQLVSRIARTIGCALGLNLDLLEAIALSHDFGHPPFGHRGETILDSVTSRFGYVFRHHFQSARYLYQINEGRNIAYQVIDGALGHNGEKLNQHYEPQKMPSDPFRTLDEKLEACYSGQVSDEALRPCTLEGCLVRVADVIAYIGKDRQDAMQLGIASGFDASNSVIIASISNDIVNNSYGKNYIALSDKAFEELDALKAENYEKIYMSDRVVGKYDRLPVIFRQVFDFLYADATGEEKILSEYYYRYLDYAKGADQYREKNKGRPERICADFIASMCDDYLLSFYEFFRKDNPDWTESVKKVDYFE